MKRIALSFAAFAALTLPALAQDASKATANVMDLEGNSLGTLELTEADGGVHITGELLGLPGGAHGIHIHQTGDCDAASKFESAGGHFNPTSRQHGKDNPEGPHAGDLENISATAEGGGALVDLTDANVTLGEGENSLFDDDGSAIVVHADADDYKTDPSGNSGERIACGVIEAGAAQ
jgi:Cu-Zn family superoxide dismutase